MQNSELIIESHPLPPFLPENARVLILGSFPPPKERWKMDFYYPNFQNDMWRIFGDIFFSDKNYFLDLDKKSFKEQQIREFLNKQGVAIFDTALQIRRLKGNASDKFLEIVTLTNLEDLLKQIPHCNTVITTGEKATDTLMLSLPENTKKPLIGQFTQTYFLDRRLSLYRMPSSSRAYPLSFEKKVQAYRLLFENIGLSSNQLESSTQESEITSSIQ